MSGINMTTAEAVQEIQGRLMEADNGGRVFTADDLRDIAARTSVAQADGSVPTVTALYSNRLPEVKPDGLPIEGRSISGADLARQLAQETAGSANPVGIIDNTHLGKLTDTGEFRTALQRIYGDSTSPEARNFLNGPPYAPDSRAAGAFMDRSPLALFSVLSRIIS